MELPARQEEPSVRYVAASLVAGVFLGGVAGGVAFPTLPQLGPRLGITPFVVGLILSINRFTRLLLNTPAGTILDRVGTRRPMIAGFFVQGLAPFGYALGLNPDLLAVRLPLSGAIVGPDSATVFLAARAAWGVGSAFVFVGAFATITHVTTPENRGRWTGYMRGGQSLGFPMGLVAGGLLADAHGFQTAFLAAGTAGLFSAVVAVAVLPNLGADVDQTTRLRDVPALVRRDPRVLTVGLVNLTVRFLFAGVLLSTVVLYADRNAIRISGFSETGVSGVVMAVSVVFASVTTVASGRFSDRLDNRASVTVPALALLAAGFAVLALFPSLWTTLAGVALVGVGVGGTNPPLLAYLGDISPEDDIGKLGGVYNVFGDVGSTVGPLAALPVAYAVGFQVEYLLCTGLVVLAGGLVLATLFTDQTAGSPSPAD